MLLAQPFLFYILDTLKKEYTLTYDVERITCDSDKMTFIAKRQIEVSSTSTEVSVVQQDLSNKRKFRII